MFRRVISLGVLLIFLTSSVTGPGSAYAQTLNLPTPGTMVGTSEAYVPVIMKGLSVKPENPLLFDFIVDTGNTGLQPGTADDAAIKAEFEKLVKYFLASLTLPEKDQWVNLSPYEKDRMMSAELEKTELGRDMLAQDYLLKQVTASLIYPEQELGKKFWQKVYAQAEEKFGSTEIPVDTFNKVWVVADKADVYVNKNTAFVVGSHLKVMLESDYLASEKAQGIGHRALEAQVPSAAQELAKQVVREIVLPALETEVNSGRNFANLRQIFHSMILATWYKKNLKEALLTQVYADKNKVNGVELEKGADLDPQAIYARYVEAYKKGVFNFIKEDTTATGETVPRKYFSGGVTELARADLVGPDDAQVLDLAQGGLPNAFLGSVAMVNPDAAMRSVAAGSVLNTAERDGLVKKIQEVADQFKKGKATFAEFARMFRAALEDQRVTDTALIEVAEPLAIYFADLSYARFSPAAVRERKELLSLMAQSVARRVSTDQDLMELVAGYRSRYDYLVDRLGAAVEKVVDEQSAQRLAQARSSQSLDLPQVLLAITNDRSAVPFDLAMAGQVRTSLFIPSATVALDRLTKLNVYAAISMSAQGETKLAVIRLYRDAVGTVVAVPELPGVPRVQYFIRLGREDVARRVLAAFSREFSLAGVAPENLQQVINQRFVSVVASLLPAGLPRVGDAAMSQMSFPFMTEDPEERARKEQAAAALMEEIAALNQEIIAQNEKIAAAQRRVDQNEEAAKGKKTRDYADDSDRQDAGHLRYLNIGLAGMEANLQELNRRLSELDAAMAQPKRETRVPFSDGNEYAVSILLEAVKAVRSGLQRKVIVGNAARWRDMAFDMVPVEEMSSRNEQGGARRLAIASIARQYLSEHPVKDEERAKTTMVMVAGKEQEMRVLDKDYAPIIDGNHFHVWVFSDKVAANIVSLKAGMTPEQAFESLAAHFSNWLDQKEQGWTAQARSDRAMKPEAPGGIDLNAGNMSLNAQGQQVDMQFDPAMVEEFRRGDFTGVRPVILNITPITNIRQLLGLAPEAVGTPLADAGSVSEAVRRESEV